MPAAVQALITSRIGAPKWVFLCKYAALLTITFAFDHSRLHAKIRLYCSNAECRKKISPQSSQILVPTQQSPSSSSGFCNQCINLGTYYISNKDNVSSTKPTKAIYHSCILSFQPNFDEKMREQVEEYCNTQPSHLKLFCKKVLNEAETAMGRAIMTFTDAAVLCKQLNFCWQIYVYFQ